MTSPQDRDWNSQQPDIAREIAAGVDRELKRCLEHAAEGLHWVGPDGTILWANQTELDLLGYQRHEYIGRNIAEFHVDVPVIQDILSRLTRRETLLQYEARLRHKDGTVRLVQINSNVLWRGDEFLHTRCFTRDITDSRAASELSLRLADIVENSADAIISQDLQGTVTSWNPAAERLYGHSAAESLGHPIRRIIPPDREHEEADIVRRVCQGEFVRPFDTIRTRKDGRPVHVALTVSPIRNHQGDIIGASKMARDISDRKRVEARDRFLSDLDDRLGPLDVAEQITLAAATHLGEHLAVNRCAYAFVEADQDTFLLTGNYTNGVGSIVGRYTFRQFGAECLRLMRAGQPYTVVDSEQDARVTDLERPSYRATEIRSVICVPVIKQGRFVAAMAVHCAIPRQWQDDEVELVQRVASRSWESIERARVTQDLQLQKRVLHSLFMQAPTLIAILRGPDHVVQLANPPVCESWCRSADELLNHGLFEAMPELEGQGFRELLDQVFATGEPYMGTETPATIRRKNGPDETVFFNFVYSPFRSIDGPIEGVFVIASDVTAQVLARNQINDLREAAESANRAKDEFLAMLGHELRNPLSPILTALQLMKLRGDDGSAWERTVIERQVNHLIRLVDDLLDVSRIARGRVELKEEILEIGEIVAKAVEMASPLIEQREHMLELSVARSGLLVQGDSVRLAQVFSNLLTNAAKYTPPRGRIAIHAGAEAGDVVVRVRDTGMGMAPEVLPRVFDLFIQERQAIDRSQGGLGLGLTIVRNLIERHGGKVAAHSDGPGSGSEFTVRLPRRERPAEISTQSPEGSDGSAGQPRKSSGARVLVVDDNQDAAITLAAGLTALGHQTLVATDAPTALMLAPEFRPAVALLDIGLPVMDGYELATRLRALPNLGNLQCIALTGYGQEADRQKALAGGFTHHFVKPVDLRAVQAVIDGRATASTN